MGHEVTDGGRSFTAWCNEHGVWADVSHCQSKYPSRTYIVVKLFIQVDTQTKISM